MNEPVFLQCGDSALIVEFSKEISDSVNILIRAFDAAIKKKKHQRHCRDCADISLFIRLL